MNFSDALHHIRAGGRAARSGWNGKGMFVFLVPGSTFKVNRPPLLGIFPEGKEVQYHGHIDMVTAQGYVVPWLASQADLLADDWNVVSDGGVLSNDAPIKPHVGGVVTAAPEPEDEDQFP